MNKKIPKAHFPCLPPFPKVEGGVVMRRCINGCVVEGIWASKLEGLGFESKLRPLKQLPSPTELFSGQVRTMLLNLKNPGVLGVKL